MQRVIRVLLLGTICFQSLFAIPRDNSKDWRIMEDVDLTQEKVRVTFAIKLADQRGMAEEQTEGGFLSEFARIWKIPELRQDRTPRSRTPGVGASFGLRT